MSWNLNRPKTTKTSISIFAVKSFAVKLQMLCEMPADEPELSKIRLLELHQEVNDLLKEQEVRLGCPGIIMAFQPDAPNQALDDSRTFDSTMEENDDGLIPVTRPSN